MLTIERRPLDFEWLDLPEGRQPLPDWLVGAHVEWMENYGNAPTLRLKSLIEARSWEGKAWTDEGDRTMVARHPDGRAHRYGFNGEITETELTRWENGRPVKYMGLATAPSEGLGGSHVHCLMAEGPHAGRIVALRGPWCIVPPPGYVDVSYSPRPQNGWPPGRPWHRGGGLAGLCITLDLYLRAVARFLPHCRVARILRPSYSTIEIADGAWDLPKTIRLERRPIAYTQSRSASR